MSEERIRIFDTTLRDGEQSPGCSMNLQEKLALARQLSKLGADIIEAGFPIASEGDLESVKAISREVREPVICAWRARALRTSSTPRKPFKMPPTRASIPSLRRATSTSSTSSA